MSRRLSPLEADNLRLKADNIRLTRLLDDANTFIRVGHWVDPLTRLASRLRIEEEIEHHLGILRRELMGPEKSPSHFSIMFIDLDGFGPINKTRGHLVGDALLQEFADYLKARVREGDIVARFAGDEFVILAPNTTLEQAKKFAGKIEEGLKSFAFLRNGSSTILGASIGSASTSEGLLTKEDIVHTADMRMSERKKKKKVTD